ncbi:hypothetical protein [Ectothiorhodospira shaposhnikovii]|uniref:hypothetical protein n=1 Tax=Ectothiorhodospira shaposhnikovii TaxID=1054 RepID=UPI0039A0B32F
MKPEDARVLLESSKEVQDYLQRAIPALEGLVEPLRGGSSGQPLLILASAADGLDGLAQYVASVQMLVSVGTPQLAENMAGLEQRFAKAIGPMVSGMESQDSLLVADVLEYELIPVLQELESVVDGLLSQSNSH